MKRILLLITFLTTYFSYGQVTVDCSAGPINVFYCYTNNDTNVFQYTSSDGTPLNLVINSGIIEGAPFDFLVVLDSDGVTELYNGEGVNGDISGLTFQSAGDTIFFSVTSDGSVSCNSGSSCCATGIDYTVYCATCIPPEATFVVVDDCDNGDQFLVDVNLDSLGDATSVTIADNQGTAPVSVSTTGTTQFGPYDLGIDVIFTIVDDQDPNCQINSQPVQLQTCPPSNDDPCSAIVANMNNDETCVVLNSGTLSGATDSGIPLGTCTGNPDDDVWFQFTAMHETVSISIQNIMGGFNVDHAVYEGTCDNLTEIYCSDTSNGITSTIVGNTYYVRVFTGGATSENITFDLCIREASSHYTCEGALSFCDVEGGLSGPNVTGVDGGLNVACLATTPNPSWYTIEIGESGAIQIQMNQVDVTGYGIDVDFVLWGPFAPDENYCELDLLVDCPSCPNNTSNPDFYPFENIVDCSYSASPTENFTIDNALDGEIYVLLVTNFNGAPGIITIEQTNSDAPGAGTIISDIHTDLGPDYEVCEGETLELNVDFKSTYEYQWYIDGTLIPDAESHSIVIDETGIYSVFIIDTACNVDATDTIEVTFVDCSELGLIDVTAFFDADLNGIFDTNEEAYSNGYFTYEVNNDGIINEVNSSTGSFTVFGESETDVYDFNFYLYDEYSGCYTSSVSFDDISPVIGETLTLEFPVSDQQICKDIAVYMINGGTSPMPGFTHSNLLVIENLGISAVNSGSIEVTIDNDLNLGSIINNNANFTITTTANGFTVDFINIYPESSQNILFYLDCPASVPLGATVTNSAIYTPVENDTYLENNSSALTEVVIGSYDPNDKMESHGPEIKYDDFVVSDEWLYYTIRFQNLGTADAINVRIEDALDSQLDENTFHMLRSSHDYVVTRTNDQLEWMFNNIHLPAEQDDEEGSKGYVYFKIKPKSGYAIGDIILNSAAIYFDFNAPVITNTFETEFVETLSVEEFDVFDFEMHPNPAKDLLNFQFRNNDSYSISIFDMQGKKVFNKLTDASTQISVKSLDSGVYFVRVTSENSTITKKLIIQ